MRQLNLCFDLPIFSHKAGVSVSPLLKFMILTNKHGYLDDKLKEFG